MKKIQFLFFVLSIAFILIAFKKNVIIKTYAQFILGNCPTGSSCTGAVTIRGNEERCPSNVGSPYVPETACNNGSVAYFVDALCCNDPPTPTPPPIPLTCEGIGGYCNIPNRPTPPTCSNGGGDYSGSYDQGCVNETNNQFAYCCEPPSCSGQANLNGATASCVTNPLTECVDRGGYAAGGPGDYGDCGQQSCCWFYPTPTPAPDCWTNPTVYPCQGSAPNTCNTNGVQQTVQSGVQACKYIISNPSCSYNNCSAGFYPSGALGNGCTCDTNIIAHVYVDYNHNGVKDYNDVGKQGVNVNDGFGNTPTDNTGTATITFEAQQTYTLSISVPAGYQIVGSNSKQINTTNNPNPTVNFYITPLYQIGGYVYTDLDQDALYDHSDTAVTGVQVDVSGTKYNVDGTGHFLSAQNLTSGSYNISYTLTSQQNSNLYRMTTPSLRTVVVGESTQNGYAASGNGDAEVQLNNPNPGDVNKVNFGINNDNQTQQGVCADSRNDNNAGTYSDLLPASYSCGSINQNYADIQNGDCPSGAGVLYSCDGLFSFGLGTAGNPAWTAGGSTPECFTPVNPKTFRTSYHYLLQTAQSSDIPITDLSTVCDTTNCQLPSNLAPGVYETTQTDPNNGDLYLNLNNPLPGPDTTNSNYTPYGYIFLVVGNLYVENNIIVPKGTVFAISTARDVNIQSNVGNIVNSSTVGTNSVNTTNIEGLYSADNNFIIHSLSETNGGTVCNSDGSPVDNKLDVVGSIIDGAGGNGGSFTNNRDLCSFDQQCPTLSYGDGLNSDAGSLPEQLVNAISIGYLSHQVYSEHEIAP